MPTKNINYTQVNTEKEELPFPESVYLNDVKGTHIGNGIYKVESPFRIHRLSWAKDDANSGYAVVGTNYTSDYRTCDVIYFTKHNYGNLSALVRELNKKHPNKYGYIQALSDIDTAMLGGYTVEWC